MIEDQIRGAPFLPAHLCWASRMVRDGESGLAAGEGVLKIAVFG